MHTQTSSRHTAPPPSPALRLLHVAGGAHPPPSPSPTTSQKTTGMLYCMEYLASNLDWLQEQLDTHTAGGAAYFIFDCPGQVELFTGQEAFKQVWGGGGGGVAAGTNGVGCCRGAPVVAAGSSWGAAGLSRQVLLSGGLLLQHRRFLTGPAAPVCVCTHRCWLR